MAELDPLTHVVHVDVDVVRAHEALTEEMSGWWPLSRFHLLPPGSLIAMEDTRVIEFAIDGAEVTWAEVIEQGPERIVLAWHPGSAASEATRLSLDLLAGEAGTEITLTQDGFSGITDGASMRAQYEQVWPMVLDELVKYLTPRPEPPSGFPTAGGL